MTRHLYTLDEAADFLRIGRSSLDKIVGEGQLETVKIGRRRLVPAECIDDYVARLLRSA